jgi:hypothetical protein
VLAEGGELGVQVHLEPLVDQRVVVDQGIVPTPEVVDAPDPLRAGLLHRVFQQGHGRLTEQPADQPIVLPLRLARLGDLADGLVHLGRVVVAHLEVVDQVCVASTQFSRGLTSPADIGS